MEKENLVKICSENQEDIDLDLVRVDGATTKELSALYLEPSQIAEKAGCYSLKPNSNWGKCIWSQCVYTRT